MAQRIIFLFLALPTIIRIGVLVLASGDTLDLLYHGAPLGWAIDLDRCTYHAQDMKGRVIVVAR